MSKPEDKTSASPRDPVAWQAWAKKRLKEPQTPEQRKEIEDDLLAFEKAEPPTIPPRPRKGARSKQKPGR